MKHEILYGKNNKILWHQQHDHATLNPYNGNNQTLSYIIDFVFAG